MNNLLASILLEVCTHLAERVGELEHRVAELESSQSSNQDDPIRRDTQTRGPKCKRCGAFTTYARVRSCGLCMRCESAPIRVV